MSQMGQTRSFGDIYLLSGLPSESRLKPDLVACPRCAKQTFLDHPLYRAGSDVSEALTAHHCGDDNNI